MGSAEPGSIEQPSDVEHAAAPGAPPLVAAPTGAQTVAIPAALGYVGGWASVAVLHALSVLAMSRRSAQRAPIQALRIAVELGQYIALGLAVGLVVLLWGRARWGTWLAPTAPSTVRGDWRRGRAIEVTLAAVASIGVGFVLLREDLQGVAEKVTSGSAAQRVVLGLLVVAGSATVPLAGLLGSVARAPGRRWTAPPIAAFACLAADFAVPSEYPGMKFYLTWCAATLFGSWFAGAHVRERGASGRRRTRVLVVAFAVLAVGSIVAVILRPPNRVQVALFEEPMSVVAPILARVRASADLSVGARDPDEWFKDRSSAPAVQPRKPPLLGPDAIVVFATVDALRADVVADDRNAALLPNFAALRNRSVQFLMARSTASQTVPSLSALFTGKYYSQLYWTEGTAERLWAHRDDSVRFPALLEKAKIPTVHFVSLPGLLARDGVAVGFGREHYIRIPKQTSPLASQLTEPVLDTLRRHKGGPLFIYLHYADPHAPYDRGGSEGTPYERYLREVALVDVELGRIRATLDETGLSSRTTLIVGADHGEAFGEHRTTYHAATLYEELLRIPLFISIPGAPPRQVSDPVSLVDLGPTVLELFGQPVPGVFMGQSLVPYLRGETPKLTRPIIADSGRLAQVMVFSDGMKLIRDQRKSTIELFDLSVDPGELSDVLDEPRADGARRLALLNAFFEVHRLKRPGYRIPYQR